MRPEVKWAAAKTVLALVAFLGIGLVAAGLFLDHVVSSDTILAVLIVLTLVVIVIWMLVSERPSS